MDIKELFVRAKFAIKVKDYGQAIKLLNKIALTNPDIPGVYLLLGNSYQAQKDYSSAISNYRIALLKDSKLTEAYNNLGVIYKNQKEYNQALYYFKEALKINPGRADIHYNMGNVHRALGESNKAIKAYQEALSHDQEYDQAHNNLGITLQEQKRFEEAVNVYQQGLKVDPNNIKLRYNLGVALESIEKYDEALENYKKVVEINPNFIEAHNNLGVLYEKLGNGEEAQNCYEDALTLDSNYIKAKNNLALLYEKSGDDKKAIALYNETLAVDPDYVIALKNLGRVYQKDGKFLEAENVYEKILTLDESDRETLYNLGQVEESLNKGQAIEIYNKLLEEDPSNSSVRKSLADTYLALDMKQEAINELKSVEKYDPKDIGNKLKMSQISESSGNYIDAVKHLQNVLATNPENEEALSRIAELYMKNDDNKKAITAYEKLNELDMGGDMVNYNLAKAYKKDGRLNDAISLIEPLLNVEEGAEGDADSLETFNRYLEMYEDTVKNIYTGGEASEERGREVRNRLHTLDIDNLDGSLGEELQPSGRGIKDIESELLDESEDSVPIINIGDTEPDYYIEEEDEEIALSEKEEEEEAEDDEDIAELRKNSMLGLLDDKDIYDDRRDRRGSGYTPPPPPQPPVESRKEYPESRQEYSPPQQDYTPPPQQQEQRRAPDNSPNHDRSQDELLNKIGDMLDASNRTSNRDDIRREVDDRVQRALEQGGSGSDEVLKSRVSNLENKISDLYDNLLEQKAKELEQPHYPQEQQSKEVDPEIEDKGEITFDYDEDDNDFVDSDNPEEFGSYYDLSSDFAAEDDAEEPYSLFLDDAINGGDEIMSEDELPEDELETEGEEELPEDELETEGEEEFPEDELETEGEEELPEDEFETEGEEELPEDELETEGEEELPEDELETEGEEELPEDELFEDDFAPEEGLKIIEESEDFDDEPEQELAESDIDTEEMELPRSEADSIDEDFRLPDVEPGDELELKGEELELPEGELEGEDEGLELPEEEFEFEEEGLELPEGELEGEDEGLELPEGEFESEDEGLELPEGEFEPEDEGLELPEDGLEFEEEEPESAGDTDGAVDDSLLSALEEDEELEEPQLEEGAIRIVEEPEEIDFTEDIPLITLRDANAPEEESEDTDAGDELPREIFEEELGDLDDFDFDGAIPLVPDEKPFNYKQLDSALSGVDELDYDELDEELAEAPLKLEMEPEEEGDELEELFLPEQQVEKVEESSLDFEPEELPEELNLSEPVKVLMNGRGESRPEQFEEEPYLEDELPSTLPPQPTLYLDEIMDEAPEKEPQEALPKELEIEDLSDEVMSELEEPLDEIEGTLPIPDRLLEDTPEHIKGPEIFKEEERPVERPPVKVVESPEVELEEPESEQNELLYFPPITMGDDEEETEAVETIGPIVKKTLKKSDGESFDVKVTTKVIKGIEIDFFD